MGRVFYTEYVRHAMRFYSRYLTITSFKSDADRENWRACHNVVSTYPVRDRDILIYVYGAFDTIADNVYVIAKKYNIHQNLIWEMMDEFELKVAKERGLC